MNTFEAAASSWHEAYLKRLDARPDGDAHFPDLAQRRLGKARVCLITDTGMTLPLLHVFKRLQLGRLSITPLNIEALTVLKGALDAATDPQSVIADRVFHEKALTLALFDVDLVVVALTRPHPQQLAAINAIAVRHGVPFCSVVLDGGRLELGPTVLPGASACLACAEVRRGANAAQIEAWEAQHHFYDRNPNFEVPGRFDSLARVAASMLGLELVALIGGAHVPAAVNRLVSYDLTMNPKTHRFIPYYEWCRLCRPPRQPGTRSAAFAAFLQRRGVAMTGRTS